MTDIIQTMIKSPIEWGGRLEYSPEDAVNFIFTADYMNDKRGLNGLPDYPTPFSRKETDIAIFSLLSSFKSFTGKTYFSQGEKHNTDISKDLNNTIKVKKVGQDINYSWQENQHNSFDFGGACELGTALGTAFSSKEEYSLSAFSTWSRDFELLPVTLSMGLRGNYNSEFDNAMNPEVEIDLQEGPVSDVRILQSSQQYPLLLSSIQRGFLHHSQP